MSVSDIFNEIITPDQAIDHLERVRWAGGCHCPYCGSDRTGRHQSDDRPIARHQCYACKRPFSVTVGTVFHRTHVPLRTWFLIIGLVLDADTRGKRPNASQLARDFALRRGTVNRILHTLRSALDTDPVQADLIRRIAKRT